MVRVLLAVVGLVAAWWLARADSWVVLGVMSAPVVRLVMIGTGEGLARRLRVFGVTVLIGAGAAVVFHISMADMLGGFVRPGEVVWSAWFYTGCITLLEGLDALVQRLGRWVRWKPAGSALRLVVILLVLPPTAVALLQVVRVKVGYDLPQEARRLEPIEFHTAAADGVGIHGYFFDRGHDVTIITAHGLGAHAENFMPYLTGVIEGRPVNGLIFDFRAHGYSDGHTSSMGYHEAKDVRAALRWLRENHPEQAERVIFYGFSLGSAAALPVAADAPETIGVVIDSGFARLTDIAWALAGQFPPGARHYVYATGLPLASLVSEAPLWRVRPIDSLARLDVPVRIVHGGADVMISTDQGRSLLEHPTATGKVIPGGGHTNLPAADPEYFTYIGRFIDLLLTEPSGPGSSDAPPDGPSLSVPPESPR